MTATVARRYMVSLILVAGAVGLRWLLDPLLASSAPFVTVYIAVVAVSVLAGLGPAILATLTGGLLSVYLFIEPRFTYRMRHTDDMVWVAFYLVVCAGVLIAIEAQSRAARLAAQRLAALQEEHERRRMAEEEREQERRWATQTLTSIGDGVITTDANGDVTFLNRVASELTGWSLAEAVGQPIDKIFHILNERTGRPADNPITRVLREGIIVGLANHTSLVRKDGTRVAIDDSGAPIRDASGAISGAVLVFRDFTERRRNEDVNARLAAIVEYAHEAILSKHVDGTIRSWNPGAEALLGYTAAEIVGRPISILLPPGREQEEVALMETIRAGRSVEQFETVRRSKNGTDVHVSVTVSPLRDSFGEVVGASSIMRDITPEKELRAQLLAGQKLESLGVLAGGLAHDFNNLLTAMVGASSLLTEILPQGSTGAALADQITKAGDRAAYLTQQLLAYSGRGRFVMEQVDASAAVREALEQVRPALPRTTELVLELAEDLPRVEVDLAQFQQAVRNLVVNASEALDNAPGTVTLITRPRLVSASEIASCKEFDELQPGEYVALIVRDTGVGMPPATLAKIYDPFFTTKFTGRGLGLPAVQGILRGHGGAICVESSPGCGTTFEVLFPVAIQRETAEESPLFGTAPTILVVDDQEMVRETARLALQRSGFQVLSACDGIEAIDLIKDHPAGIDVVLLDLTMPVLSGRGALDTIRDLRPALPIVLCSGHTEAEAMHQIDNMTVAGYLRKPFTAAALRAAVAAALYRKGSAAV